MLGERTLTAQLGQLRLLVAQRIRLGMVAHCRQHLAALDRLARHRQTLRAGLDTPAMHRLHATAGIRVHHHAPGQLDRGSSFRLGREHGADAHAALRRLGHVDAAVGQARQAIAIGIGRGTRGIEMFAAGAMGTGCGLGQRHERQSAAKQRQPPQADRTAVPHRLLLHDAAPCTAAARSRRR